MSYPKQFNSSASRITKKQERINVLNDVIMDYMKNLSEPVESETVWIDLVNKGKILSQSSFNNRLRYLVQVGLIAKQSFGYNKNTYCVVSAS